MSDDAFRGVFVTGTDTGVGKTVVSAALVAALRGHHRVRYWKPIQTGIEHDNDTETVRVLGACVPADIYDAGVRLLQPVSPHLAARAAGQAIDLDDLVTLASAQPPGEFWVVEGAGGALVPVNGRDLMIDLIARLGVPAVVVARSSLGTINHTLLTLDALRRRSVGIAGVVMVGEPNGDNRESIERYGDVRVIGELPLLRPLTPESLHRATESWTLAGLESASRAEPRAPSPEPSTLASRDAAVVWHPYTQMLTRPAPLSIVRGEGVYLYTDDGRRLLDGTSSWWVNIHGHSHPVLNAALAEQAARFEHVVFANCTHEPAVALAERLLALAPRGLSRVFYSDNGSTAVEVAMKMALQYWANRGATRRTFITLHHAYHGDTVGAMSASELSLFTRPFAPLLFDVARAHAPYCYRCPVGLTRDRCHVACALAGPSGPAPLRADETLEALLERHAGDTVAVLIEPMLQGAGGMIVWPREYLAHVRALCDRYDTLMIADEVLTGFGRTGRMFACEHAAVSPDILCLSKALTAGYLPLGATLATDAIYEAFLSADRGRTFFHGHSFTANPLACAVALASLDLLRDTAALDRVAGIERQLADGLTPLLSLPTVGDVRVIGGVGIVELVADKETKAAGGYLDDIGPRLSAEFIRRGLLLRPLGNVIYIMPPFVITDDELQWTIAQVRDVVSALTPS